MITVSDRFIEAQARPDAKVIRKVQYKRRYWKETTQSYAWESSWSDLPTSRLKSVSAVTMSLDTDQLNEFKVSNLTITVDNSDNYFRPDHPNGFFGQDSASPNHPYEPYWTKFRVQVGYKLLNGSTEYVTRFVGLFNDYVMDSTSKTCQLIVVGLENLLEATKAEAIATSITQENVGVGNGSNKDFTTLNPGVGEVTLVSINGITKIEGSDYTVSQTNDASLGAKISFVVAPDVAAIVRATYYYWPQGLQFSDLVISLLTAAGISSYSVSPVVFSGSVLGSQAYTTQADWDSGVKSLIDSAGTPGSMVPDYANATTEYNWTNTTAGWTQANTGTGSISSDGTKITLLAGTGTASMKRATPTTLYRGAWKFTTTNAGSNEMITFFVDHFVGNSPYGYKIWFSVSATTAHFQKVNGDDSIGVGALTLATWSVGSLPATYRVYRDLNGTFKIYENDVLKATVTDTTYTQCTFFRVLQSVGSGTIQDIWLPSDPIQSIWTSPVIDMGATPTAFDSVIKDDSTTDASITYKTATSTDGISFDSFVAINASFVPQSSLKRYGKIQITFSIAQGVTDLPQVDDLTFRWITSSTGVTIANFTGISVYEALQAIGAFTNYEYGFDTNETFFFRSKSSGDAVMAINESDYATRITGMDSGYSRVYGIVRATYGSRTREVSFPSDFAESPQARVKNKRYEISPSSDISILASIDIATGVANTLLNYLAKPRRRFKLSTKMLVQLDLSDAITVSFANNTPPKKWYLGGQNLVNLGDQNVWLWGDKDQIVFGMKCKIIGARYDVEAHQCEFDVEEVL
jgi:hypothetical protein